MVRPAFNAIDDSYSEIAEMIAEKVLPSYGKAIYAELKNICIWRKTNAGMGSLYRSQHELVFVFKNGTAPHINNINLGVHGRNRSNVWDYGGINSFGKHRDELLAMHPTVKPLALVADAILDCSKRGGIVLDAFAGSGTTLIAAERTGRRGFGIGSDVLQEGGGEGEPCGSISSSILPSFGTALHQGGIDCCLRELGRSDSAARRGGSEWPHRGHEGSRGVLRQRPRCSARQGRSMQMVETRR